MKSIVLVIVLIFQFAFQLFSAELSQQSFNGVRYTVCVADPLNDDIRLFWKDENQQPLGSFDNLEKHVSRMGKRLVFGMNAGMFQENLSPVGLLVIDGKIEKSLNTKSIKSTSGVVPNFYLKPNGVFGFVNKKPIIKTSANFPKSGVRLATQSGPMLVVDGQIHSVFTQGSTHVNIRNGVGIDNKGRVVFVISDGAVNFYDFALFFKESLSCRNALYLDGSVSGITAPEINRSDWTPRLGPLIGIVK
ncbi:MAG: phosphodiester glycosidase family protein [Verrucomicrobiota bacterium]|nr:phosphodiester glycosidase family protein [Verrucomicrobiota bacterium]